MCDFPRGLNIKAEVSRYRSGLASAPIAGFKVMHNKHNLSLEDLSTLEEQNWLNDQVKKRKTESLRLLYLFIFYWDQVFDASKPLDFSCSGVDHKHVWRTYNGSHGTQGKSVMKRCTVTYRMILWVCAVCAVCAEVTTMTVFCYFYVSGSFFQQLFPQAAGRQGLRWCEEMDKKGVFSLLCNFNKCKLVSIKDGAIDANWIELKKIRLYIFLKRKGKNKLLTETCVTHL